MSVTCLSRRDLFGLASAATAAAALPSMFLPASAQAQSALPLDEVEGLGTQLDATTMLRSLERAFAFQNFNDGCVCDRSHSSIGAELQR